jgi:hypothetical protein
LRLRANSKMTSMITNVSTYTGSMIASAPRLFRMFGHGLVTGAADDAAHSRVSGKPDELLAFAVHELGSALSRGRAADDAANFDLRLHNSRR